MSVLTADVRVARPDHLLDAGLVAGAGEVIALVGPNGAGKTTLLRALAGTIGYAGSVSVDGRAWDGRPPHERAVGLVHQDHALFPHLSALQNVAFGPRSRGVGRRAARERAQDLLDRLGVGDLAMRRPSELSGGQSQRVAVARALATGPRLLLLDEPFAALDVAVAQSLREELDRHLRDFDGVTVLVTHDAVDVLTLADRLLVLEDGRVAQDDTPHVVATQPGTAHAARLVGRNVLHGTSAGTDVSLDSGLSLVSGRQSTGPVLVTFAPSAVTLTSSEPSGSARNRWPVTVHRVAPANDPQTNAVRVQLSPPELVADVTAAAAVELGLAPGARVWASVKATDVEVIAAGHG